jgi:hypothetical protein
MASQLSTNFGAKEWITMWMICGKLIQAVENIAWSEQWLPSMPGVRGSWTKIMLCQERDFHGFQIKTFS